MPELPDWLFNQAGGLPYLFEGGELRVVVITSRRTGDWIFPKGVIDPGYTAETTAVKEAEEEAGVVGEISGDSLGAYRYTKRCRTATVQIYPLAVHTVLAEWDECHSREREILSPLNASTRVGRKLRPFLAALERHLTG